MKEDSQVVEAWLSCLPVAFPLARGTVVLEPDVSMLPFGLFSETSLLRLHFFPVLLKLQLHQFGKILHDSVQLRRRNTYPR